MKIFFGLTLGFILLFTNVAHSASGCCAGHGGVCGCACCDGKPLSTKCALSTSACDSQPKSGSTDSSHVRLGDRDLFIVQRVIDGDTLLLSNGTRVRLIGVDTPETVHPKKAVQYFGKEASNFTKSLVLGKKVWLEYDQNSRDKYARLLAYVFLEDNTLLNEEIIKQGYGYAYTKYPFRLMERFRLSEQEARKHERGLWKNPVNKQSPLPLTK